CTALKFHWSEYTAIDGAIGSTGGAGAGAAGAGGIAGDDMIQVYAAIYGGFVCYLPTDTDGDGNNTYGFDGKNGGNGTNGAAVTGCSASLGMVSGGDWIGGGAAGGKDGGNGGGGGKGGKGGFGGLGGTTGVPAIFCTDAAGRGGDGGNGGHGSGGGGGCGGSSFGVFTSGVGTPNYCMGAAANTFSGGAGG